MEVVRDMYAECKTVVRSAAGTTDEFVVEAGFLQGSALSPFLFAMIMDRITDDIRLKSQWNVMFADDIVICNESREGVERELEKWRAALEGRGMKVSRSKTEYMCFNGKKEEEKETIKMQGVAIARVSDFKYLGVTLQSNRDSSVEVKKMKKRVQAGWNGWRNMSGVFCDRGISAKLKGELTGPR